MTKRARVLVGLTIATLFLLFNNFGEKPDVIVDSNIVGKIGKQLVGTNFELDKESELDLANPLYSESLGALGMGMQSLRYPGGNSAQEYFWKSNCLVDLGSTKSGYSAVDSEEKLKKTKSNNCDKVHGENLRVGVEQNSLVNYKAFMNWAYNINPEMELVFVVNVASAVNENRLKDYAQYAAQWFKETNRYADQKGYRPVLHWEIGSVQHLTKLGLSAKRYANIYKLFKTEFESELKRLKADQRIPQTAELYLGLVGPAHLESQADSWWKTLASELRGDTVNFLVTDINSEFETTARSKSEKPVGDRLIQIKNHLQKVGQLQGELKWGLTDWEPSADSQTASTSQQILSMADQFISLTRAGVQMAQYGPTRSATTTSLVNSDFNGPVTKMPAASFFEMVSPELKEGLLRTISTDRNVEAVAMMNPKERVLSILITHRGDKPHKIKVQSPENVTGQNLKYIANAEGSSEVVTNRNAVTCRGQNCQVQLNPQSVSMVQLKF